MSAGSSGSPGGAAGTEAPPRPSRSAPARPTPARPGVGRSAKGTDAATEASLRDLAADLGQEAPSSSQQWHPRTDKLWVTRDGAVYTLSIRKGARLLTLTSDALRQLGQILDVPVSLLQRLSGLPNLEDCRLLNLLLWAQGADAGWRLQAQVTGDQVRAIGSEGFQALDLRALVRELEVLEARGTVVVRRFDRDGARLWLELGFPQLPPIDATSSMDRNNGRPDVWRPGALVVSSDDGSAAVTIVPALFRDWGNAVIPVPASKGDVRKRRHAGTSADVLLRQVVGDIVAASAAPFGEAGDRLRTLHQRFLPGRGIQTVLDSADIPMPSAAARDAAIRALAGGRPTWFRLLSSVAKELRTAADHRRRLACGLALGRQLWSRGSSGRSDNTSPASKPQPSK